MHIPPVINTTYEIEYMDLADEDNASSVRYKGADFCNAPGMDLIFREWRSLEKQLGHRALPA